jgi:hypothetical protein
VGCASELCSEARLNFGQIPLPGDYRLRRFPELFLNCLLRDVQKVTANRGGMACHGKPKVVLGKSSSARIRICGPVGCRKSCGVWLRQSPRSSLRGEGVPGGKCSRARRLRRGGGKSTRIEHANRTFGRRTLRGACCSWSRRAGRISPQDQSTQVLPCLSFGISRCSPHDLPCSRPTLQQIQPDLFPGTPQCKRKKRWFPSRPNGSTLRPPDKTGQNLPATKLPWRESHSSAVAFPGPHLPGVIRPPIPADHGLPLARFKAFKAVQATTDIRLTGSLLVGKIGSPLL